MENERNHSSGQMKKKKITIITKKPGQKENPRKETARAAYQPIKPLVVPELNAEQEAANREPEPNTAERLPASDRRRMVQWGSLGVVISEYHWRQGEDIYYIQDCEKDKRFNISRYSDDYPRELFRDKSIVLSMPSGEDDPRRKVVLFDDLSVEEQIRVLLRVRKGDRLYRLILYTYGLSPEDAERDPLPALRDSTEEGFVSDMAGLLTGSRASGQTERIQSLPVQTDLLAVLFGGGDSTVTKYPGSAGDFPSLLEAMRGLQDSAMREYFRDLLEESENYKESGDFFSVFYQIAKEKNVLDDSEVKSCLAQALRRGAQIPGDRNEFIWFVENHPDLAMDAMPDSARGWGAYFNRDTEEEGLAFCERYLSNDAARKSALISALGPEFLLRHPEYEAFASEEQKQERDSVFEACMWEERWEQEQRQRREEEERRRRERAEEEERARLERVRSISEQNRPQILNEMKERSIYSFVHFTDARNLPGILADGLRIRSELEAAGAEMYPTDPNRLDEMIHSLSLSVSFPNYKMFYSKQMDEPERHWCVLQLRAGDVVGKTCLFHDHNAATARFRNVPDERKSTLEAFRSMFAEEVDGSARNQDVRYRRDTIRTEKNPERYTTSPQAEILCLDNIPRSAITACFFENEADLQAWQEALRAAGIEAKVFPWFFRTGPYAQ